MKLSKKVWLIVGIGVIVALLVIVFTVYFQQVREQQELSERLSAATVLSARLEDDEGDLEDELAQAESLLDASQAQYPQAIESIEYGEYIFEIVDRCNLNLSTLTFPKPTAITEGAVRYSVVSLSLPVSGALADIFEFIDIINNDARFASTQVNSVNLNVGGGGADISVTIYSYKR
jgi:type II secretory pathway pseudopilin PulG